jgi:hypothetical protein
MYHFFPEFDGFEGKSLLVVETQRTRFIRCFFCYSPVARGLWGFLAIRKRNNSTCPGIRFDF